jgi:hypothetical protein
MKRMIIAAVAAIALPAGAALAQSPAAPAVSAAPPGGPYSGYLFPDDGSPSGDEPGVVPLAPQPPTPTGIGGLTITHVYLFPPSEGSDDSGGNG